MTPTKKEPPRNDVSVDVTKKTPEAALPRVPKEPVVLDLLDILLGNCHDEEIRDLAAYTGSWIEQLFQVANDRPLRIPAPPIVPPLGAQLYGALDRIRTLIGGTAKVGLVVAMSDRERFDSIHLPGQLEAGCDEHGLRVKVFDGDDLKIVLMNVGDKTPPAAFVAETAPWMPRMSNRDDGIGRRTAHA